MRKLAKFEDFFRVGNDFFWLSTYIKRFVGQSVPQERNISPTQERGINIFTCEEWDKHSRGGQTSYFLDGGGYDDVDVDEEMDVNE